MTEPSKIPIYQHTSRTIEDAVKEHRERKITVGEVIPPVEGVKHNDKEDPHLALKKLIKEQYPAMDAFMMDVVIRNHEQLVALHGEDYTEEQYVAYVEEHSSSVCEREEEPRLADITIN